MSNRNDNHKYADIINLPHHTSPTRSRMPMLDRAAQFSPFAALTGYDAAVAETARLTERKIELDENEKAKLNEKLRSIVESIDQQPVVTVTYFEPDERKSGGIYVSLKGQVKRIDEYEHTIIFSDKTTVWIEDVVGISIEEVP